jgi:hypothetical protein
MRTAMAAQLVVADADGFRFRHARTRDAVLAGGLPPDRAALAGRALGAVCAVHPDLEGGWCELASAATACACWSNGSPRTTASRRATTQNCPIGPVARGMDSSSEAAPPRVVGPLPRTSGQRPVATERGSPR